MPRTTCAAFLIWSAFSGLSHASEVVYLKSGFTINAESHTSTQSGYVFRVGSGAVELATDNVARIEVVEDSDSGGKGRASKASPETAEELLERVAREEGLQASFLRSVAKAESGMRQEAVSSKGAIGLMQLMPRTAAALGVDAAQSETNALGGAKYLRSLLLQYHGNSALALAAYNAGPGAVARYSGVPPYAETRQYIVRVTREFDRQNKLLQTRAMKEKSEAHTVPPHSGVTQ